jgi:integrase
VASVSRDSNGNRTIQFVAADGKRRSVRLGKLTAKAVGEVKLKIEALNAAAIAKISIDGETAKWIGQLDAVLYDKLASVGLVPKRPQAERTTLGGFIDDYLAKRTDIKPRTRVNLLQAKRNLVEFFGAGKPMTDVTEGDGEEFRLFMREKLSENTVRRHCGRARQFFRAALKRRLIECNPFGEMKGITVQANRDRFYFVSRAEAQKVLDACPDAQWKLLFALSRFGGLRCPSEHLALRWGDIDWERGRIRVRSPKTEHHEGKESRLVPLFPELRPYLEQVFDDAEPGTEYVITRYRDLNTNLRTHLERIIEKAGLQPWPKLFQNLRSTRETELAESFPIHVICSWIGNSPTVANKHYLQVTDDHFEAACKALQNPVQQQAESTRNNQQQKPQPLTIAGHCEGLLNCTSIQVPPVGLEPTTH